jgi:RNA polymerase sigma-70 factor (ECF subfamily)
MESVERALTQDLAERIGELWERTGDEGLGRIASGRSLTEDPDAPRLAELPPQEHFDWINTALMQCFQRTGDSQVFALLYELNEASFAQAIRGKVRRTFTRVDERDVLQEVFLNIYRYPHRFMAERADSFRNWGHRIALNTLSRFLKLESRRRRTTVFDEALGEHVDEREVTPLRRAADAEQHRAIDRAFLIYLNLYLVHFRELSEREQRALTRVEVEGWSYRDTAEDLGIAVANLKMVIFRARRKIYRGMSRTMSELEAEAQRAVTAARRPRVDGAATSSETPVEELAP